MSETPAEPTIARELYDYLRDTLRIPPGTFVVLDKAVTQELVVWVQPAYLSQVLVPDFFKGRRVSVERYPEIVAL